MKNREVISQSDVHSKWLGDVQPLPRDGFEVSAPYRPHSHVIYALIDNDEVFYVGQTICSKAYLRVRHHIALAKSGKDRNRAKSARLIDTVARGCLKVRIVSFASSQDDANHLEIFYMFFFGFKDGKLTNMVQGGVGGFDPSNLDKWKNYIYSDENRIRASLHSKSTWSDPLKKASMAAKVKSYWTVDKRYAHREKLKALWADPDYVNKVMAARSTPEQIDRSRECKRKIMTERWKDSDYRESQVAERRSRAADPEWLEKMRIINSEINSRPEVRQKLAETTRASWTPERRKKHSELLKARNAAKRSARGDGS